MSQGGRSRRSAGRVKRPQRRRLNRLQVVLRFIVLIGVIGLMGIAGALMLRSLNQHSDPVAVEFNLNVNPSLNPVEAAVLASYLSMHQDALNAPLSADPVPVAFTVDPGENARQIADALLAQGLIADATLFRNYLRYYGLDRQLEAGTYQLSPDMTVPQIAVTLTDATPPEVTVRITEGWRREQIAQYLDAQPDLPFGGAEFLAISGVGFALPQNSGLVGLIPLDATAEGFLFPDTYRLASYASAADLLYKMLTNLDGKVTPQMRNDAIARGLSLYQVVTLASIVEREAAVPDERPLIASVYLNRLTSGIKLEADPTVQYAMGYQAATDQWWNLNLTQSDYLTVDSPYNTYLYPGLPPGPIASPGLDSIQAVIYPADSPYLFFRADCDGSGRHRFAVTFDEHVANACP